MTYYFPRRRALQVCIGRAVVTGRVLSQVLNESANQKLYWTYPHFQPDQNIAVSCHCQASSSFISMLTTTRLASNIVMIMPSERLVCNISGIKLLFSSSYHGAIHKPQPSVHLWPCTNPSRR